MATVSDSLNCAEHHITSGLQQVSSEASRKRVFTTPSIGLRRCFPQASPTSLEVSGNILPQDYPSVANAWQPRRCYCFTTRFLESAAVVVPLAFHELPNIPVKPLWQHFPTVRSVLSSTLPAGYNMSLRKLRESGFLQLLPLVFPDAFHKLLQPLWKYLVTSCRKIVLSVANTWQPRCCYCFTTRLLEPSQ